MLKIVPNEPGETDGAVYDGFQGERLTEATAARVGAEPLEKTLKRMFWHHRPSPAHREPAERSADEHRPYV